jgi:hypothetical protein
VLPKVQLAELVRLVRQVTNYQRLDHGGAGCWGATEERLLEEQTGEVYTRGGRGRGLQSYILVSGRETLAYTAWPGVY